MVFIFSTPVLIRHLWQPKTVVFLYLCLMHAVLFTNFPKSCDIPTKLQKVNLESPQCFFDKVLFYKY